MSTHGAGTEMRSPSYSHGSLVKFFYNKRVYTPYLGV